jgi:hypothetical protein
LSYLGPGVIYLGVHGERFLALARQAFGAVRKFDLVESSNSGNDLILSAEDASRPTTGITITTSIDKNRLRAVETTPLVARGEMNRNAIDEYVEVVGVWNHLIWYLTGMPIWSWIARLGKGRLQDHITEMAMKSPHPIRIGDVEYKRMVIPIDDDYNETTNTNDTLTANPLFGTDRNKMVRDQSLPQLSNLVSPTGGSTAMTTPFSMNINQQIGQGLLEQYKKNKMNNVDHTTSTYRDETEVELEADPQDAAPSWSDFFIAIFLILFGFMALFVGMYSIFL